MIALQHQETIEGSSEASLKCLGKGFPCSMQKEGFSEFKEQIHSQKISNVIQPQNSLCEAIINNPNGFHNKPKHGFGAWSPFHPKSQKVQQLQMNASEGQFRCVPFSMLPQGYSHDLQTQEFEYFVVIDFEATCDKEKIPHPQEIIEFPSVIVSSRTGKLEACFQTYVKPTCNQHLSAFCKDLTGIQQNQVDRGVTLGEALLRHDKWLEKRGIKNTNFVVVTWSNWDCRVMLESECRFKKIRKPPYFNRWINLKVPFNEFFGGVRCNLKEAVQLAGLVWQGRPHCGLDDAKNTARLLTFLMHRGFRFSITNSLIWQTSNYPLTLNHYQEAHMSQNPDKPNNLHLFPYQFHHPLCLCGVQSSKVIVRKPGPKYGSMFFGCGNWTAARGALCHYFEWAHGLS